MTDSQVAQIPREIQAPGVIARLARRPLAVLGLLGLLLWLPGVLSLPALDRDESRFAQSSRQMVESGDPVDIRFGQVPRYKKPVGIYWLQAAATKIFGYGDDSRIWTYRLPSLLGAIAAARLTVWCASAFMEAEAALIAGLLLLSTVLLAAEATIATTDAVLLATIVAVQGVLLRQYRAVRDGARAPSMAVLLWGWAALGIGILIKGPVTFAVAIATIAGLCVWDRDWRWLKGLRLVPGVALVVLLVTPWLVAITLQSHGAFLQQSVGHDFAAKLAGGQESHGAPPGYYLLLAAATLFPAILFMPSGLVLGWSRRAQPAVRFVLVWAILWWIVVEAVPTKLPHYILPAVPPLCILAALFVTQATKSLAITRWLGAVLYLIGAGLLVAAIVIAPRLFGGGDVYWLWAVASVGAVLALAGLVVRNKVSRVVLTLLAMLVLVPGLTAGVGPRLGPLWVSQALKRQVQANALPGDPPPAIAGYQEPSLVFALGKDVMLTDGAGAADARGLALVEDGERAAFLARLAQLHATPMLVGDVHGLNYSRGRKVHVFVYRMRPVHP